MTDELDRELQARLQGAAERIGSKTDRLEEVQLAGNRRQDRRRVVASGAAATAFVVALGASLYAVASFGGAETVIVSPPANGGDDSASGSAAPDVPGTTAGPADDGPGATDPPASETTSGSAADGADDGSNPDSAGTTGPVTTGTRPTLPDDTGASTLPGGDTTIPTATEGVVGSVDTTAGSDDPYVLTTIPLPGGVTAWEYTYVDVVVQQWTDGVDDCVRVYTPVELDPAAPAQTIARQGNYEVCQQGEVAEGDWYVETDELPQIMFLLYALPPLDPAAVWVSNSTGGQIDGFVDGEYWGVEVLESFQPTTLHILRLNGQEETIDLPSAADDGTALRLYIGRPMALG